LDAIKDGLNKLRGDYPEDYTDESLSDMLSISLPIDWSDPVTVGDIDDLISDRGCSVIEVPFKS